MARPRTDIRPRLVRAARDRFLTDGVDGASPRRERVLVRFQLGPVPLVMAALADVVREGQDSRDLPPPLLLVITFAIGVLPQLVRRSAAELPPFAGLPPPDRLAPLLLDVLM